MVFGPALAARDQQVTAALLKQAATAPVNWPKGNGAADLEPIAARALGRVPADDRVSVATSLASPSPTLAAQCLFDLALFEELLSHPEAQAAAEFHIAMASAPP